MVNLMQLSRECDQIAAEFYNSDANTKKMVYKNWLKKVKLTANYIDNLKKNTPDFFAKRKKVALSLASSGEGQGKSRKSRGKVGTKLLLNL
jgi:hypothetical protein